MDTSKLKSIIATQNDRRERQALGNAEDIIEQIAGKQSMISRITAEIAALRQQLVDLQVEQLDVNSILGGE